MIATCIFLPHVRNIGMKSVTYWYQFFTRCEELVPILHGVKFTKCEIYGSIELTDVYIFQHKCFSTERGPKEGRNRDKISPVNLSKFQISNLKIVLTLNINCYSTFKIKITFNMLIGGTFFKANSHSPK